jgi:hypothetical protein
MISTIQTPSRTYQIENLCFLSIANPPSLAAAVFGILYQNASFASSSFGDFDIDRTARLCESSGQDACGKVFLTSVEDHENEYF